MEIQGKENTVLPMLRKQYAEIQRGIDNLLNAIQQGIVTPSTKQRLEDLEKQKSDISVQIIKEEMSKPLLTKDQILFWFHRFRKYNTRRLDHKRRLIDSFINTIYLYDDKMVITFNYKDGSETVSLSEIENSDLSSDLTASALPKQQAPLLRCLLFFVCAKNENEALGECRALSVSAACGRYSEAITAQRSAEKRRSKEVFRRVPQEGLQSNFDPFCPCHRRRGLCIVRDDFFFLKSHRLTHAVAPPLPKKSLTFRGPHKFAAQPCGFEPFFFCCLSLAHGPFCRILIPKTGADFPSGGIRLQRFRLLHHQ